MTEKEEEMRCSNCGTIIEGDYFGCKECEDLFCCNQCFERHPCEVERKAKIEKARLFDEEKAKIAQAEGKLVPEIQKAKKKRKCDVCGAPAQFCKNYSIELNYYHSIFCSEKCKTKIENQWRIKGKRPGHRKGACKKTG